MLLKPTQDVYVPPVYGQEFLPASYDCYPPPPPPPPIVQPPGGGNGSGPPHGDCTYQPIYQLQYVCNTLTINGVSVTSCSWQDVLIGEVQVCP